MGYNYLSLDSSLEPSLSSSPSCCVLGTSSSLTYILHSDIERRIREERGEGEAEAEAEAEERRGEERRGEERMYLKTIRHPSVW